MVKISDIKNLKQLNKYISTTALSSVLIFLIIMIIVWQWTFYNYAAKRQILVNKQILSNIYLYQTTLAAKLGIIANSGIFVTYLRSGEKSRHDLYIKFLSQIKNLQDKTVLGMEIASTSGEEIFKSGTTSPYFIVLKLSYYNDLLNNKFGLWKYNWKIYLSKTELVRSLQQLNHRIVIDNTASKKFNMLGNKLWGEFEVSGHSQPTLHLPLNLKAAPDEPIFYILEIIVFAILISLGLWLRYRVKKVLDYNVATPIQQISNQLLNREALQLPSQGLSELSYLTEQIIEAQKHQKEIELGKIAAQVSHDIQSPLVVIAMLVKRISPLLDENDRLMLRTTLQEIKDIIHNLLIETKLNLAEQVTLKNSQIIPIVESIIDTKAMEVQDKHIKIDSQFEARHYSLFVKLVPHEFKRVLSNLINNSIEAVATVTNPYVMITTSDDEHGNLIIKIIDNGIGISPYYLDKVFDKNISFNKSNGSGLGLYYAKNKINSWGGEIKLTSQQKIGTEVIVILPPAIKATWFRDSISIPVNFNIVILDDSDAIHKMWYQRFEESEITNKVFSFYNCEEFLGWKQENNTKSIYLVDHELSHFSFNGLEIIKKLGAFNQAYLVTNSADDLLIQDECDRSNIGLISKRYIPHINIKDVG